MVDNEVLLAEVLKISNTLNNFQIQTAKQFDEVREEIKESRRIENEHWLENVRLWEENKKRWEENDKRWEQNERRWEENDKRWEQNERRWEENDKRWQENDKRWEENDKFWDENRKLWKQNEENRKKDRNDLMDAILRYDISISTKLGDPNANKMRKILNL